jgi:hypothetical protein
MHAHFRSHVYHRHSHETYSFGVTDHGAQAFTCRGGTHVSTAGMVMTFNPDDPHDGHSASTPGFTYRMIHIDPALVTELIGPGRPGRSGGPPLFPAPVVDNPALARRLRLLHTVLTGTSTPLEQQEHLTSTVCLLARHASSAGVVSPVDAVPPAGWMSPGGVLSPAGALPPGGMLQPLHRHPRLHRRLRPASQRLPAPAPAARRPCAAQRRHLPRRRCRHRRLRGPGSLDPVVPPLLRRHPRRLPPGLRLTPWGLSGCAPAPGGG